MVQSAWETGDPGLIFIDRINRDNPTPHLGDIESTNPCGEQPLLPFEACVLGSINLSRCVKIQDSKLKIQNLKFKSQSYEIDWDLIASIVHLGVRFLDNAIDVNKYPIPDVKKMHEGNRKIGLGVMVWADMLIQLAIPYNSPEALKLAVRVMRFIRSTALRASADLAGKRGPFPTFKGTIYDAAA